MLSDNRHLVPLTGLGHSERVRLGVALVDKWVHSRHQVCKRPLLLGGGVFLGLLLVFLGNSHYEVQELNHRKGS